jgi:hypothetical protein
MAATSGMGTVYGENVALNALLGSSSPATVYLCVYSAAPSSAGGGTEITNLPRLAITNNATNFPAASSGAKTNGTDQTIGPASSACAEATHWGIHAHSSSDQLIWWGPMTTPRTCGVGDSIKFAAGDIDLDLKGNGE